MNHDEYRLAKQANRERLIRKMDLFGHMQNQQYARIFAVNLTGDDRVQSRFVPPERPSCKEPVLQRMPNGYYARITA